MNAVPANPESRPPGPGAFAPGLPIRPDEVRVAAVEGEPFRPVRPISLHELWQFRWTALGISLLVTVIGLPVIWGTQRPSYAARTTLEVSPSNPRVLYATEDSGVVPLYKSYLNNQVGIIRSQPLLRRAVERPEVSATTWLHDLNPSSLEQAKCAAVALLGSELEVRTRKDTFLLDVDLELDHAADVATIVNSVADEYLQLSRERFDEVRDVVADRLALDLREMEGVLGKRREVIDSLRARLGTHEPERLVAEMRLRVEQAESTLRETHRQRVVRESQKEDLEKLLAQQKVAPPTDHASSQPAFEEDARWLETNQQLQAARGRHQLARIRMTESHPEVRELALVVQNAERAVRERETQLTRLWSVRPSTGGGRSGEKTIAAEMSELRRDIAGLQKEEEVLTADLSTQRETFKEAFECAQQMVAAQRDLQLLESKCGAVRQRVDELATEREVFAAVRLVSAATDPAAPHADRRKLLYTMVLVAAISAGLLAAWARAALTPYVCAAVDLPKQLRDKLLAALPMGDAVLDRAGDSRELRESLRGLRAAVLQAVPVNEPAVLLVTSGSAARDKGRVALLLASSLGATGRRVLLIDADRRPAHDDIAGVSEGTAGCVPDAHVPHPMQGAPHWHCDILAVRTAVQRKGDPSFGNRLEACVDEWRQKRDILVVNCAPLGESADARVLASRATGVLLVAEIGKSHRKDLHTTLEWVVRDRMPLLGAVLCASTMSQQRGGAVLRASTLLEEATVSGTEGIA